MRRAKLLRPEVSVPAAAVVVTVVAFCCLPLYSGQQLQQFDVYNTLQGFARLAPLVLALGITMLAGEFDLSVVGTYALGGMLAVQCGQSSWVLGIAAALGAGLGIGVTQGWLIAKLRISSMPVTLATYIALLGLTSAISGGLSKSYDNADVTLWVDQAIASVLSPRSLMTLAAFVVAAALLGGTRWGRELRAIGGDRRASRVSGVRDDRLLVGAFAVSGVLAAGSGALLDFSLGSANPDPGVQPLILAAAGALLGGVSLSGGRGSVIGLLGGAVSIALLAEIVTVAGLATWVGQLFYAVLLGLIVAVDAPDLRDTVARYRARITTRRRPPTRSTEANDTPLLLKEGVTR